MRLEWKEKVTLIWFKSVRHSLRSQRHPIPRFSPSLVWPYDQISMFQMFTMRRIHLDAGEAVRHWRRMSVGPGKTENISEPLPGMMGFICSHAVLWAVVRRWSARRSGGRRWRVEEESRQKESTGGTTWKTKTASSRTADLSFYISYFFIVFYLPVFI